MDGRENDIKESYPEIEIIPSAERIKMIRQREHLILQLVKMGFKQLASDTPAKTAECVLLLKDCAQGKKRMGVRIFIPEENDHLLMALLGDADENAAVARAVNAGGYFSAVKDGDKEDPKVLGDNYDVTMIREPEVTSTRIQYMSLGSSNRIWALIRKVFTG